jgi:hypothetical protein
VRRDAEEQQLKIVSFLRGKSEIEKPEVTAKADEESPARYRLKKIYFLANAFISPFNKQTMHVKSLYTKQHVFLKILYPGGIQTQVFSFLRLMQCPLRHAAMALVLFVCLFV